MSQGIFCCRSQMNFKCVLFVVYRGLVLGMEGKTGNAQQFSVKLSMIHFHLFTFQVLFE